MKRFITTALLAVVLATAAAGQSTTNPPHYCCGPSFTFGGAKAHAHGPLATTYGFFVANGLVTDETNNEGNLFLGNTITIRQWSRRFTYWYDWSADSRSPTKLSTWSHTKEMLTIQYDPACMLAVRITSPSFPE